MEERFKNLFQLSRSFNLRLGTWRAIRRTISLGNPSTTLTGGFLVGDRSYGQVLIYFSVNCHPSRSRCLGFSYPSAGGE